MTTAPSFIQLMTENPLAMIPEPIMAPTIEWVVETGKDFQVEKFTHKEAASIAESAPISTIWGSVRISVETRPLRVVLITWEPINTAQKYSTLRL